MSAFSRWRKWAWQAQPRGQGVAHGLQAGDAGVDAGQLFAQ
jgi:hypothetical protein